MKIDKSKILLKNALTELMTEKAFQDIKLNELCEKAMVHKTTFYNHFEDKYDLLNYIINEIDQEIKSKLDKNNTLTDYYMSLAKEYIKIIKDKPSLFKSVINSTSDNLGLYIFFDKYTNDIEKEIKDSSPIPCNYVAKFYVNAVLSVINEWFNNGMVEDCDTIIKYIEILIKGETTL